MIRILVVGGGGREHALVWKLAQSSKVSRIYAAPGNAGIARQAECLPIAADDIAGLLNFALDNQIDLTVVGPEVPLIAGIVDAFEQKGLRIFGPAREPALLEGSKAYAKGLMLRYGIPTGHFAAFSSLDAARHYVGTHYGEQPDIPLVIKADGEAAGKGVFICHSDAEAQNSLTKLMEDRVFGAAGETVVVEEFLQGEEASLMVFTDGTTIVPMIAVQDHKRALDGDCGPNTGGMGCYAPVSALTPALYAQAVEQILKPAIEAIRSTGIPYKGVLYAGLMITPDGGLKTLEFNCRFGDPETQAVLPLLETDLVDILLGVADAHLDEVVVRWRSQDAVCVVLASGGYPGPYAKGLPIEGLDQVGYLSDVSIFHAGTKIAADGEIVTDGGRVLGVTALGADFAEARARAYAAVRNIHFEHMHYRTDIGNKNRAQAGTGSDA
jgi:phosphoribosylamine--glycine ligase